jgi:hypothetical protein
MTSWLNLTAAIVATWRVCYLLAYEDGPVDLVVRLRRATGDRAVGRLIDCPYCLSLWLAVPFAGLIAADWRGGILLWLAISGGACLLEQASAALRARAEPPVLELPPDQGEV